MWISSILAWNLSPDSSWFSWEILLAPEPSVWRILMRLSFSLVKNPFAQLWVCISGERFFQLSLTWQKNNKNNTKNNNTGDHELPPKHQTEFLPYHLGLVLIKYFCITPTIYRSFSNNCPQRGLLGILLFILKPSLLLLKSLDVLLLVFTSFPPETFNLFTLHPYGQPYEPKEWEKKSGILTRLVFKI